MKVLSELMTLLAHSEYVSLAQQLLQGIPDNQGFEASNPVPLQQIRDIYRQRARHIERVSYPVAGFPELVSRLEAFSGDAAAIFQVHFNTGDYVVFADVALSELAGILKFPKKTAAQEAALAASERQHEALFASSRLQAV